MVKNDEKWKKKIYLVLVEFFAACSVLEVRNKVLEQNIQRYNYAPLCASRFRAVGLSEALREF